MKHLIPAVLLATSAPLAAFAETRCGWFINPTPANFVLVDADDPWWLAAQGTSGAPGFYDALDSNEGQGGWVSFNGGYGYGCACIEGVFGPIASGSVLHVTSYRSLPLAQCHADPALPSAPFTDN